MTILESILAALRGAASYNKHELAAPRVILWTDEERLWAPCIDLIRAHYPALWSLGEYCPEKATGPAAWLRYQLESPAGQDLPVIYLPGIDRAAFRNAQDCPDPAKHLFALQFLGQFWSQRNGRSWTPYAFFVSDDGGLGLDVSADQDTKTAIQESLAKLMDVEVTALQGRKLEAGDFRAVVTKDPVRTLLRWMGAPDKVKVELQDAGPEWASFCAVCKDTYGFNPDKDGAIVAAEMLSSGRSSWELVWSRYKEAPRSYPGVRELLDLPGQLGLFDAPSQYRPGSNQVEEEKLEKALLALSTASQKDAINTIQTLATQHEDRANWVWAVLGESPLALAVGPLRDLALAAKSAGTPTKWDMLADYFMSDGWKADYCVLRALGAARTPSATKAVTAAIRTVYLPWLEKFSTLAQALAASYPNTDPGACRSLSVEEGMVYLFADGMRMDVGRSLETRLRSSGLMVEIEFGINWSALPTVTATAKPAWQPLAGQLGGPLEGVAFQPKEKNGGKSLTHDRFKQMMEANGIGYLDPSDPPLPTGCMWSEYGSIDTYGHEQGAKLAWRLDEELAGLQQRIEELLRAGWSKVQVITDHGWLLLPGGLPKVDLPKHLTTSRWGRCAIPSAGAQHGYPLTSWFWDSAEAVVLAPGVSCFMDKMEYSHGGLTMQEALVPFLTISSGGAGATRHIVLKELKWSGMRLNVVFDGAKGLAIDLRGKAADAGSSFAASPVLVAENGQKSSLLVPDDDAQGSAAFLVVLDPGGQPIFKQAVVIGEK